MIINCTSSQQIHANQSQLLLLRQQSALSSSSSSSASVEQQHHHHHHPLQQHLAYLQVVQATQQQQQHLPYYYVEPSSATAPTPLRVAKRVPPQYPAPVSCYYNHNHHPHHHSRLAQPPPLPQDRTGGLHEATGSGTPPTMDGGHNPLRLNNILYEDNNNHVSTVKVDRSRRGIVFHRFLSSSS